MIIADIAMPGLDGYELLRRLRELPAAAGGLTPVIALTAYGSAADRARVPVDIRAVALDGLLGSGWTTSGQVLFGASLSF